MTHRTARPSALVALMLALAVVLTGCTGSGSSPSNGPTTPPAQVPTADDVLAALAQGLAKEDVTQVAMVSDQAQAAKELELVLGGMGSATPTVKPGTITYAADGRAATGDLAWTWTLGEKPWTYSTKAALTYDNGWKVQWAPSLVHPDLTARSRMRLTRQQADRGRILGANNYPLVDRRDVVRVGIDKSQLKDPAQIDRSARALATLVKIDPAAYAAKVKAAGAKAFVVAIVNRSAIAPDGMGAIPGALAQNDTMMLTPYKGFAGSLLGTVGEATDTRIQKSKGAIQPGDQIGLTGIQAVNDATLRGVAGVRVDLVERKDLPPADSTSGTEIYPVMLWQQAAVPGKDLVTTLDFALQKKVEDAIRTQKVPTAVVVVQPSTGKILALANSDSGNDAQLANWGHNAPGSTFKVITSLAMLRHGMTMDSIAPCPVSVTLNGRKVTNFDGYPTADNGNITLRRALGRSCNTSFAGYTPKLGEKDLQNAAASLGVGVDYDAGFKSFFGSVPDTDSVEARMEQTFGQGTLQAAPLSMVAVPASVKAGKTVVPWLIVGKQPPAAKNPLTEAEAAQLRSGMAEVVALNKAKLGFLQGAKTGTAQFGTGEKLATHIWVVGFTSGDVAAAIYQDTGAHSADLGPLLQKAIG